MTQPNTMNLIIKSTAHAREKHPEFAPGITQALCLAQEELGEMAKAINDNAPWAEIESEIYDTIAVLVRIAEKDYLKAEPEFTLFPPDMVRNQLPQPCERNPYEEVQKAKAQAAAVFTSVGFPFENKD